MNKPQGVSANPSPPAGIRAISGGLRPFQWLLLAVLGVAAAVSLARGFQNARESNRSDDFQWEPARQLLSGKNPYRAFLETGATQPRVTNELGNNTPPNYPVTGYLFLAPFAVLDWSTAKTAWAAVNVLGLLLIAWAIWLIAAPATRPARFWTLVTCLAMLCSSPAREQISAGQHTIFSTGALLWAWILGQRSCRWRWVSMVLIAMSWLKFSVTVPLTLAFLVQRRWREAAGALGLHLGLYLMACLWTATSPVTMARDFLAATKAGLACHGIRSDVWDTLSVGREWLPDFAAAGVLISLGCMVAVVWVARRQRLQRMDGGFSSLALLAIAACLVGFHFRYDFLVFAIFLAWVLGNETSRAMKTVAGTVAALNWFGARVLEGLYYEPIDAIAGVWHPMGTIGMGTIAALTWLGSCWMLARVGTSKATQAHHLPTDARTAAAPLAKPESVAWG